MSPVQQAFASLARELVIDGLNPETRVVTGGGCQIQDILEKRRSISKQLR